MATGKLDDNGAFTFPNGPTGSYYLVAQTSYNGQHLIWDLRVDLILALTPLLWINGIRWLFIAETVIQPQRWQKDATLLRIAEHWPKN